MPYRFFVGVSVEKEDEDSYVSLYEFNSGINNLLWKVTTKEMLIQKEKA